MTERGRVERVEIRVRYAETDQMGVVYYANYPVWFEVSRAAFMRARGLPYARIEEEGHRLPVSGVRYRLHAPARYDDLVVVEIRPAAIRSRQVTFAYRIMREGTLLVEGETDHVCVNREMRPVRLPSPLRELLTGEGDGR